MIPEQFAFFPRPVLAKAVEKYLEDYAFKLFQSYFATKNLIDVCEILKELEAPPSAIIPTGTSFPKISASSQIVTTPEPKRKRGRPRKIRE